MYKSCKIQQDGGTKYTYINSLRDASHSYIHPRLHTTLVDPKGASMRPVATDDIQLVDSALLQEGKDLFEIKAASR